MRSGTRNFRPLIIFLRRYWLLAVVALPFFVALDDSSIWDANEAFYVQTPREMIEREDWLVPYFNGQPRLNKPPLSYWVVGLFYQLFGVSIFWERLVMALLACGSVLAVFVIGRLLLEETTALLGAGIFATTFRFLVLSRRLLIDVLMLFWLLWAVAFFLYWLRSKKAGPFLLCSLSFGLAFLSKGPVALLPLLFLGLYLLATHRLAELKKAPWVSGTVLGLAVGLSWFFALGWKMGWRPVWDFLLTENWGRFSSADFGPERGPFYYVAVFFGDFFPWSLFWPASAWWAFKLLTSREREKAFEWIVLLGLWMSVYFFIFSFSRNKQEYYILPLYPASALWVAYYLRRNIPSRILSLVTAALLSAAGALLWILVRSVFPDLALGWFPLLALPLAAGGLIFHRPVFTVTSLALLYTTAFALYLGPLEQYRPAAHFAKRILEETSEPNDTSTFEAGYYRFAAPSLAFYLNRSILELSDPKPAARHLESSVPVYLLVSSEHFPELQAFTAERLQIVDVRPTLYTTARTFIEGLKGGSPEDLRKRCTRDIYLVSNGRTP